MSQVIDKPVASGVSPDPLVGSRLGRFRVDTLLGHGNRASVYRGVDTGSGQAVAIRVLDRDLAADPAFVERFHQAVTAAAAVQHPQIVPILYHGDVGGTIFVIRPYIVGGTLRDRLKGALPLDEVLRIFRPIADALDHAHRQGLIHGDLKPGNILLSTTKQPLLTDLGTAQALSNRENNVIANARGAQFGTPEYVSPEQCLGRALDGRADLYALGIMLYEALAGRVPFRAKGEADTARAIVMAHMSTPPPRPRDFNPELGPKVEAVLLRALAKDPGERYPTGTALLDALDLAAASGTARGTAMPQSVAAIPTVPGEQQAAPPRRMRPMPAIIGVLVLALALGGFGISRALSKGAENATAGVAEPTPAAPPVPGKYWFFGDGWTGAGYHTVITVQNPNTTNARVTLAFISEDGPLDSRQGTVLAGGSTAFDLSVLFSDTPRNIALGTQITADLPVTITRTISKQDQGLTVAGAPQLGTTWRFLENQPVDKFDKWLELTNFGENEATVRVTYRTTNGQTDSKTFTVAAKRLLQINLKHEFPNGIGRWTIESTNGAPIIAEITTYDQAGNIVTDTIGELVR